jgi:hypothetical protein
VIIHSRTRRERIQAATSLRSAMAVAEGLSSNVFCFIDTVSLESQAHLVCTVIVS